MRIDVARQLIGLGRAVPAGEPIPEVRTELPVNAVSPETVANPVLNESTSTVPSRRGRPPKER